MPFQVNNTVVSNVKVEKNGTITDVTSVRVEKDGQYSTVWVRKYLLTITKSTHSTVVVGEKSTAISPINREVFSGGSIHYGNYVQVTVSGSEGYVVSWALNGVAQTSNNVTVQIDGDINIVVTETAVDQSLTAPGLSGTYNFDSYGGFYYLNCSISNLNSCSVMSTISIYSIGDVLEKTTILSIDANSSKTYSQQIFSNGVLVNVAFSAPGYGDSSDYITFGSYQDPGGSGGSDEDETTTTS